MEATLDILPLRFSAFWLLVWSAAGLTGLALFLGKKAVRARRLARGDRTGRPMGLLQGLGIALMSVPVWIAVFGFLNSIERLADPNSTLAPYSPQQLSRAYWRSLVTDLGYLGVGFLLWTGTSVAWQAWRQRLHAWADVRAGGRALAALAWTLLAPALVVRSMIGPGRVRELARRVRIAGVPLGPGESRSALVGYLLFPLLLAATWGVQYLVLNALPALVNGDESRVWENMSPYHALMISIAAGVTEELVYRAFLMVALARLLQPLMPARRAAPWAIAWLLQAVLFGLAHGGYGTWIHVLQPFLFGLVAGLVAWRFGIWAAIVLHVLVDVFVFTALLDADAYPWAVPALLVALLVNVAVMLGVAAKWTWRRARADPA